MSARQSQSTRDFWALARVNFEKDDGSLPGVGVVGMNADELAIAFDTLRGMGQLAKADGTSPTYWDVSTQTAKSIDEVPNAAACVAAGQAEPFHFTINGVRFEDVPLPLLGVFVLPDSIFLDYRMGAEWTCNVVLAFFGLLKRLRDIAPLSQLESDGAVLDWNAFHSAWMFFLEQKLSARA